MKYCDNKNFASLKNGLIFEHGTDKKIHFILNGLMLFELWTNHQAFEHTSQWTHIESVNLINVLFTYLRCVTGSVLIAGMVLINIHKSAHLIAINVMKNIDAIL